jgi:peptidoglycan-associated lipoprotein
MKSTLWIVPALAASVLALPACATRSYVRTNINEVNGKVETLTRSVEETQEQTRRNEGRIGQVDKKADGALSAADRAALAATAAAGRAGLAQQKADEVDLASKRLVYTVVLSDSQGDFAVGQSKLPAAAVARIDELVAQLKADPKGAFFEIEGHTDAIGPRDLNDRLGLERADAVKRYLYEHHQIPLHRINVISYGSEKPVAPNSLKSGRAQNRRVVIRVLA